jgi:2-phosphosulfolactate phosphatase
LQLNVFFNPVELSSVENSKEDIYIVIDVMRATTTLAVMFDQGATYVLAAQTLEQAQSAAQKFPGRLLCGERHTKIPPGFDYGNSPAYFAQCDLTGRDLILTTSNGTRAFFACPKQGNCLAGSFYNGEAVITHALTLARKQNVNISIVCAGEYGYFSLEDSACAGYFALELLRRQPGLEVFDNTYAAITLYENYPPARLRKYTRSARELIDGGQEQDLEFCLNKSVSKSVPVVIGQERETGLLMVSIPNGRITPLLPGDIAHMSLEFGHVPLAGKL